METLYLPALPAHPDARQEYEHLQKTCDLIDKEIEFLETELHVKDGKDGEIQIREDPDLDDETLLNIFRIRVDRLRQLTYSANQAYFARLDFLPDQGVEMTCYLGRWGVLNSATLEAEVVDWRSPVANLYYAGQLGRVDYEAPDGTVSGELKLKRMLTVSQRDLEGIFDTDVVSRDRYLQDVLGSVSTDRLREIVTTIQAEQNLVIRHPLRQDLIVQGTAGSGKTTIALHRIAYLLYTWRENLRAERMMILAPSPLFLSYISQVLPDLGVERAVQTTFEGWCRQQMGSDMPKVAASRRLEENLNSSPEQRAAVGRILRVKGSLEIMERAEKFLLDTQRTMLPEDGLTLSGVRLFTRAEVEDIFLRQLQPFPLAIRVREFRKYLRKRLDDVCCRMKETLQQEASDRLDALLNRLPDGEERRRRARKLLDARDARISAIDEIASKYLKNYTDLFPDMHILPVFRNFLAACGDRELREMTERDLEEKQVRQEDLALLCFLYRGIHGVRGQVMQHIVIDECQDFSPFQMALLKQAYPAATLTAVGDLSQGIHADEGIRSWQEWMEPVFHGEAAFRQLVISYRNTVEIMEKAALLAHRYPIPGVEECKPVLRHGTPVKETVCQDIRERMCKIREQAEQWLNEGYHSIALITKTEKEAGETYRFLKGQIGLRLLSSKDTEYAGGVLVIPASMVKGMEFDCVALCNVSEKEFPEDEFLSRVLYVMMTRPLHCLHIFAQGNLSPMLGDQGFGLPQLGQ